MSNLGLGGLVSGVNTDDILYKLMQIENARIDLEKANKADLAAKQDAWHKVKSSLETLRTKLDGVRLSGSFRTRKATLSDENVASVTTSAGATLTTHKLSVTKLAQAEAVGGKLVTSATTALSYSGSILINDKKVTVTATDTLYNLRDRINDTADVGVKAEVVKVTTANPDGSTTDQYRLTLTAKSTGAVGMKLANDASGDLLYTMGLDTNADTGVITKNTLTAAQNAVFTLDNQAYETASNTISDAVPGLTITLKKADLAGAETDITVGQDTSAVTGAVNAWVDALNSTVDTLRTMTKYDTVTKKKGVLNGDGLARNILNSLTSTISTEVPGLPSGAKSLSDVGVTTGAWGTDNYGKVLVDATKLTQKLTADEDAVARIFGAVRLDTNLALSSAGATATATSGTASAAIDGDSTTAWTSVAVTSTTPQTLTVDLGSAKSIDQVKLYNPDGTNTPTAGIKNFKLYYQNTTTGAWTELESVTTSAGSPRTLSFDPVLAQKVKLEVSATYDDGPASVADLQILEQNRGSAVQMYRFVNGTLAFETGALDVRDDTYSDQIKALDDKINAMYLKMADQQARLKAQFDRMESALSRIQSQGNQLAAMMGMNQK